MLEPHAHIPGLFYNDNAAIPRLSKRVDDAFEQIMKYK